ncbi:MAG: Gfo/Idh/MocA family oxidoreductase [Armatimonadetes bacterium]|nr:Gfo/Idh/MocA family oxidoreductase [Armatimonadota bacterium]
MKNIAVIGSGTWGLKIIKSLASLNKLALIADINKTNFEEIKKEFPDLTFTNNIKDIFKNKEIKGVVIATPPITHFKIAEKLLLNGKDIWVEKPFTLKSKEARKLKEISIKKNKIILVGHILLYHPAYCKLKQLIKDGYLGEIRHIASKRLSFGKIRKNENVLWSFSCHDIAAILYLLDKTPLWVSCIGNAYIQRKVEDIIYLNLDFGGGINAHINSSWLNPYKERKLIVIGEEKCSVIDELDQDNPLKVYNQKVMKMPLKNLKEEFFPVQIKNLENFSFNNIEMLKEECLHFIDCLENRKKPKTNPESAVKVIETLEKCVLSIKKNGKWIKI